MRIGSGAVGSGGTCCLPLPTTPPPAPGLQGWEGGLLQDALLILCSAVLTLLLLLDAFARENAYQMLASLAANCVVTGSQLAVFLVGP